MRTPLYDIHVSLGARMISFAGWEMPVSYTGIIEEHNAVRNAAGIFDISHMGEIIVEGFCAEQFLQRIATNDASRLHEGEAQYSFLSNEHGGIIDDTVIYRIRDNAFMLVVNAANKEKDYAWIKRHQGLGVRVQDASKQYGLLALQGPRAAEILQPFLSSPLQRLRSYTFIKCVLEGKDVFVSRTGYTGEDGFEIYCNSRDLIFLWSCLSEQGKPAGLLPCGLGCRDTLRLEAGMVLYGNDLDENCTPFEAGLMRFVAFREEIPFIGQPTLEKQTKDGSARMRVNFSMETKEIARAGCDVFVNDERVGNVTSGSFSPTFRYGIGMAFVDTAIAKREKKIFIEIRKRQCLARIQKNPLYKRNPSLFSAISSQTLFEKSKDGRKGYSLPELDVPAFELPEEHRRKSSIILPELSEPDVVKHYIQLSRRNFGIDNGFYPLGSCTMKYNPAINNECANLSGFLGLHPHTPMRLAQGSLRILHELEQILSRLVGFSRFSLQPAAGAQAEFTALLMMKAYLEAKGEKKRTTVLIPDVAHGTNPASVQLVGWNTREVKTTGGILRQSNIEKALDSTVACIMITNPNTLGIFEPEICEINKSVHDAGALSYLDGANFNALIGRYKPADQGFDSLHLNLHKTFSTPHGGGGPGAGALGISSKLVPFLPVPTVEKNDNGYYLDYERPESVGKLHQFFGNFLVLVRAYAYILSFGNDVRSISDNAVANTHYLKERLCPPYECAHDHPFLHEFVLTCEKIRKETGVRAFDIAKRIMDFGFHPPTMYFPLTVKEALMIEPTETISREMLDSFADAMKKIYLECYIDPEKVKSAPHTTVVRRVDEVYAARNLKLKC